MEKSIIRVSEHPDTNSEQLLLLLKVKMLELKNVCSAKIDGSIKV